MLWEGKRLIKIPLTNEKAGAPLEDPGSLSSLAGYELAVLHHELDAA